MLPLKNSQSSFPGDARIRFGRRALFGSILLCGLLNSCVAMTMNAAGTIIGGPVAYAEIKLTEGGILDCETGSSRDRQTLGGGILVAFTYVGLAVDTIAGLAVPPVSCLYLGMVSDVGEGLGTNVLENAQRRARSWEVTGTECVDQELMQAIEERNAERRKRADEKKNPLATGSLNTPKWEGPAFDPERPEAAEFRFSSRSLSMPLDQFPAQRNFYCTERFLPISRQLYLRNLTEAQRRRLTFFGECRMGARKDCFCLVRAEIDHRLPQ